MWLQEDPDIQGKTVMERLEAKYPGKLKPGVLRTVQRRISEWRQTMARKLVLGGLEEPDPIELVSSLK